MLDIYTCILSCIIFNDLVPDLYFHDTDTWDSCDIRILITWYSWTDLVILTCDFLWSCVYITWQLLIQDISCSLYSYHNMHARSPCTQSIVLIFLSLLLLSVLDTANHIVLMSYLLLLHLHILSFNILFSRVLLLVHFWWTFIIFYYRDQKASIESWS